MYIIMFNYIYSRKKTSVYVGTSLRGVVTLMGCLLIVIWNLVHKAWHNPNIGDYIYGCTKGICDGEPSFFSIVDPLATEIRRTENIRTHTSLLSGGP